MGDISPDRRRTVVEALARHRARRRIRETGGDWDAVLAECIAEADASPETDSIIALAATAPPPEDWDPEVTRQLRRLLRKPSPAQP